tara:strand:+ start:1874 stop:2893 length:1020 start_codon:yes stop_codon:yes gene_type:complete
MNNEFLDRYSGNGMKLNFIQRKAFNEFNEAVYNKKIIIDKVDKCFCGSKKFIKLSRFDRFGLPFGTQICTKCGLINQTVRINNDSMSLFYDKYYWNLISGKQTNINFTTPKKETNELKFISDEININEKEIKVFEVGVGSGHKIISLKNALNKKGYKTELFGCDYSEDALNFCSKNKIKTVKGGFDEISKFGKADILILSHLFEHLPDLKWGLEKIEMLTHSNSYIYVELPGIIDLPNKLEYMYNYQDYNVLAHTYNFSLKTLSYVFSTKNYKLLKGDEYIRSIFQKGKPESFNHKENINEIIKSLKKSYEIDLKYSNKINNPLRLYIKNIYKSILSQN